MSNDATINFRVPADLKQALLDEARRQDISLGHLLRRMSQSLVDAWVEQSMLRYVQGTDEVLSPTAQEKVKTLDDLLPGVDIEHEREQILREQILREIEGKYPSISVPSEMEVLGD